MFEAWGREVRKGKMLVWIEKGKKGEPGGGKYNGGERELEERWVGKGEERKNKRKGRKETCKE